ncbi:MAG: 50S ribosomal protein L14e [Candidatus Diapherotrites archaeon]|nr:50S ribosomal protein L14e [Candidatus Diapherotrites archaeon]
MPAIEVGRVCYLARGRNAGQKAVIVEAGNGIIVTVQTGGKRKKCNIRHLFPTKETGEAKALKETKAVEKAAPKPKQEKKRAKEKTADKKAGKKTEKKAEKKKKGK